MKVLACLRHYYVFFQYNQYLHIITTQSQYTDLHHKVNEVERNWRTVAVCFADAPITTGLPAIVRTLIKFFGTVSWNSNPVIDTARNLFDFSTPLLFVTDNYLFDICVTTFSTTIYWIWQICTNTSRLKYSLWVNTIPLIYTVLHTTLLIVTHSLLK